jgi:hypothetical protein
MGVLHGRFKLPRSPQSSTKNVTREVFLPSLFIQMSNVHFVCFVRF